jgi:hypothetical protein
MDHYVKIGRHEGQYVVFCLPAQGHTLRGRLPPHTFRDKGALTAFLRQTLHIPQAAIDQGLQRGESIRVSSVQVGRWPWSTEGSTAV